MAFEAVCDTSIHHLSQPLRVSVWQTSSCIGSMGVLQHRKKMQTPFIGSKRPKQPPDAVYVSLRPTLTICWTVMSHWSNRCMLQWKGGLKCGKSSLVIFVASTAVYITVGRLIKDLFMQVPTTNEEMFSVWKVIDSWFVFECVWLLMIPAECWWNRKLLLSHSTSCSCCLWDAETRHI